MRKIRNYKTENQTGYKTNFLLNGVIQSEITSAKRERNGSAEKLQVSWRGTVPSLSQLKNASFDFKVNLLRRLRHRLSIKAKIKCQSANLWNQKSINETLILSRQTSDASSLNFPMTFLFVLSKNGEFSAYNCCEIYFCPPKSPYKRPRYLFHMLNCQCLRIIIFLCHGICFRCNCTWNHKQLFLTDQEYSYPRMRVFLM